MLGMSEAYAESVASLLKGYARISGLGFGRVVEKAKLRSWGVTGMPQDDRFVLRVWARFFGETLEFRFHTKKRRQRRRNFALGKGSKTVHRTLSVHLKKKHLPCKLKKSLGPRPRAGQWLRKQG